ncbi:hypothetical protein [Pelagibacterium sp.]|uniref:hypothetical protein n=1 Tax=Pelagibacterium sp. TaxID=1967288 RepID=UPI003A945399
MDLQTAFDEGFEAVRAYVDDAFAAFEKRLEAIEARQPEKGDPGADGKGADPDTVAAMVSEAVERAVSSIPVPQDGKSVTVEDIAPLVEQSVSEAVKAIPLPKDGKDGADGRDGLDAVTPILKDGVLIFTMSDGSVKEVGFVTGADGKDGENGKDGRDGFSLENFDATLMKDGRTILLTFDQGDTIFKSEMGVPAMIYRGVYKEGQEYERGDTVTWGGSLWHCDAEKTIEKPDSAQKHWTLAAKRGRDGKAGKDAVVKSQQPVKVDS